MFLDTLSCCVDCGGGVTLRALFRKEVLIQRKVTRSKKFLLNGIKLMVVVK
jgi:hypothetical protein